VQLLSYNSVEVRDPHSRTGVVLAFVSPLRQLFPVGRRIGLLMVTSSGDWVTCSSSGSSIRCSSGMRCRDLAATLWRMPYNR